MFNYRVVIVKTGESDSDSVTLEQTINEFEGKGYTLDSFTTTYVGNLTYPTDRYTHFLVFKRNV